jgi:muramoyltetrapeptide carboxypeptidase
LDNNEVKVILCARGGYGSLRIIDALDFTQFVQHPKWICGYSDITVFHAHIQAQYQIATLHSTMPIDIHAGKNAETQNTKSFESLLAALRGEPVHYKIDHSPFNRQGSAEGVLIGGNLSILYALVGSKSFPDTTDKILFIEDVDEYLYHIDRMMLSLKRANLLSRLKGLVVGGLSKMNDNPIPYGKTAEEIIVEHCADYSFPILFNFPAGHISPNVTLRMGGDCRMMVAGGVCALEC